MTMDLAWLRGDVLRPSPNVVSHLTQEIGDLLEVVEWLRCSGIQSLDAQMASTRDISLGFFNLSTVGKGMWGNTALMVDTGIYGINQVAQRAAKVLRFGPDCVEKQQPHKDIDRLLSAIESSLTTLSAVSRWYGIEQQAVATAMEQKRHKLQVFMRHQPPGGGQPAAGSRHPGQPVAASLS